MTAVLEAPLAIERATPRELLVRQTWGTLLRFALADWLCIGLAWLVLARAVEGPWAAVTVPALILLIAGRLHALGILTHDAAHMPLARGPGLWLLEALIAHPVSTTIPAMRYHHSRHHAARDFADDPYVLRARPGRPLLNLLLSARGLLIPVVWGLRPALGLLALACPRLRNAWARVFLMERSGRDVTRDREVATCLRAEPRQLASQALVLALLIAFPGPVLLGWVLPLLVAGALVGTRLLAEHEAREGPAPRGEWHLDARDHHTGFLGQLLVAPHWSGLHRAHHLHPQVACQALPALGAHLARR